MWDAKSLNLLDVCLQHEGFITSILYIPDEALLLTGGVEERIGIRKLEARCFSKDVKYIESKGFISYLCHIDDENLFASVGNDPNIRLYDLLTF